MKVRIGPHFVLLTASTLANGISAIIRWICRRINQNCFSITYNALVGTLLPNSVFPGTIRWHVKMNHSSLKTWLVVLFIAATTVSAPTVADEGQTESKQAPPRVASTYIIGPGDSLRIFVWRNEDLSVTVPVRPDGRITTPLVEEMVASGKTAESLARDIEEVLAEYIRSPKVNIIITDPQSLLSVVKIVGQVRTPQGVPFREGMTALDLVLAVGGMTEFASGNKAKVVRRVNGESLEIRLKLDDLINKGDLSKDIELLPGDVVVVPESLF